MAIPVTNPYYSQLYLDASDAAANGPVPLPPCPDAWSAGPALDQTTTAVRWISYGFNFVSSENLSKSTMIKDENDIFYVVSAYCPASTLSVRVNVYDAENDVSDVYSVTPPAELVALKDAGGPSGVRRWTWLIRKKSSTELDFVVRYYNGATGDYTFQHYTWTIGDGTMTYAGGYTYNSVTYGDSQAFTLHGPLVIDLTYISGAGYIITYDLDTDTGSADLFYSATGKISANFGMYHGGAYVYCIQIYSTLVADGECEEVAPAGMRTVNQDVRMYLNATTFALDGSTDSWTQQLDQVTLHDCTITSIGISAFDHCSANPDNGTVYFRMLWVRGYSDSACPPIPYVHGAPGAPDHSELKNGVFALTPGGGSFTPYNFDEGYDNFVIAVGPGRYAFPSRGDPMSLISSIGDPNLYGTVSNRHLFHWQTLSETAVDAFDMEISPDGTGALTGGAGQRNDNSPILIGTKIKVGSYWHNKWYDSGGSVYLDQSTTITGTSTNFLPIHGMMGKWPVRHYRGRWAIFGPNTPPTSAPRWQVV